MISNDIPRVCGVQSTHVNALFSECWNWNRAEMSELFWMTKPYAFSSVHKPVPQA